MYKQGKAEKTDLTKMQNQFKKHFGTKHVKTVRKFVLINHLQLAEESFLGFNVLI